MTGLIRQIIPPEVKIYKLQVISAAQEKKKVKNQSSKHNYFHSF